MKKGENSKKEKVPQGWINNIQEHDPQGWMNNAQKKNVTQGWMKNAQQDNVTQGWMNPGWPRQVSTTASQIPPIPNSNQAAQSSMLNPGLVQWVHPQERVQQSFSGAHQLQGTSLGHIQCQFQ